MPVMLLLQPRRSQEVRIDQKGSLGSSLPRQSLPRAQLSCGHPSAPELLQGQDALYRCSSFVSKHLLSTYYVGSASDTVKGRAVSETEKAL